MTTRKTNGNGGLSVVKGDVTQHDQHEEAQPTVMTADALHARAAAEPTAYAHIAAALDTEQEAEVAKLTPFAREVQFWLWDRVGPPWTRLRLSRELGISESAVNAWFNRGTLPDPVAFNGLLPLTRWSPAHLMALAEYAEMPPRILSEWDFILDKIAQKYGERTDVLSQFAGDIHAWRAEYMELPRRASRPKPKRKGAKKASN